jgi:hypothetical protein
MINNVLTVYHIYAFKFFGIYRLDMRRTIYNRLQEHFLEQSTEFANWFVQ